MNLFQLLEYVLIVLFRSGPLKYEADVYEFAKKVFNEYLDRAGVQRFVKPPKWPGPFVRFFYTEVQENYSFVNFVFRFSKAAYQ